MNSYNTTRVVDSMQSFLWLMAQLIDHEVQLSSVRGLLTQNTQTVYGNRHFTHLSVHCDDYVTSLGTRTLGNWWWMKYRKSICYACRQIISRESSWLTVAENERKNGHRKYKQLHIDMDRRNGIGLRHLLFVGMTGIVVITRKGELECCSIISCRFQFY